MVTDKCPPQARQEVTGPDIGSLAASLSLPQLPRRRTAVPQRVQMLLVARGVHGLPKAAMHPGAQLPLGRQRLHRFFLPYGLCALDEIEDAALEHEESA